jgi:hypothetical protein
VLKKDTFVYILKCNTFIVCKYFNKSIFCFFIYNIYEEINKIKQKFDIDLKLFFSLQNF